MKFPKLSLNLYLDRKHDHLTKQQTKSKTIKKFMKMSEWQQDIVSNCRAKVMLMLKWRW